MALYGVDISHWQGEIDFDSFKKDYYSDFMIAKATEGRHTRDSHFDYNMDMCKNHGILRGAYHYVRGDYPWYEQTNNFLSVVYPHIDIDKDILLALDVEDKTLIQRGTKFTQELVSDIVTEIHDQTGVYPLIYVSLGFMSPLMFRYDDIYKKCGGWIAAWGGTTRKKPKRGDLNTSIWQCSSRGTVAGITGNVDLDIAYMSKESWLKFANPRG